MASIKEVEEKIKKHKQLVDDFSKIVHEKTNNVKCHGPYDKPYEPKKVENGLYEENKHIDKFYLEDICCYGLVAVKEDSVIIFDESDIFRIKIEDKNVTAYIHSVSKSYYNEDDMLTRDIFLKPLGTVDVAANIKKLKRS